jgi:hypothetical protein
LELNPSQNAGMPMLRAHRMAINANSLLHELEYLICRPRRVIAHVGTLFRMKRCEYLMPSHQTKQDQKNLRPRALTKQVFFFTITPRLRMQIGQRQSQRYIYRLQDSPASHCSNLARWSSSITVSGPDLDPTTPFPWIEVKARIQGQLRHLIFCYFNLLTSSQLNASCDACLQHKSIPVHIKKVEVSTLVSLFTQLMFYH